MLQRGYVCENDMQYFDSTDTIRYRRVVTRVDQSKTVKVRIRKTQFELHLASVSVGRETRLPCLHASKGTWTDLRRCGRRRCRKARHHVTAAMDRRTDLRWHIER